MVVMDRSSPSVQPKGTQMNGDEVEENTSELLANALKKMDGLLGRYASNHEHEACRWVGEFY